MSKSVVSTTRMIPTTVTYELRACASDRCDYWSKDDVAKYHLIGEVVAECGDNTWVLFGLTQDGSIVRAGYLPNEVFDTDGHGMIKVYDDGGDLHADSERQ